MSNNKNGGFDFSEDESIDLSNLQKQTEEKKTTKTTKKTPQADTDTLVSCLRNERVIVRFLKKQSNMYTNPRHVFSGGMGENSVKTFVVPKLSSGSYVNVLTNSEKAFLENFMGLEYDDLSVYKKKDNFWDDSNENGINTVHLLKQDNYFNLADPQEYIKYKILLANKDMIAPSLKELEDRPKATYQFVIISEGEENKRAQTGMSYTMQCYKEYGKIEDNINLMRTIIEIIDGRPTSSNSKLEFLQVKCNEMIQNDPKRFLAVVTDPLLNTKSMIKQAIEAGIIANRGNFLYLRSDNTPLCEQNEDPTLSFASKFLNNPKHQDILFAIQAKLNN